MSCNGAFTKWSLAIHLHPPTHCWFMQISHPGLQALEYLNPRQNGNQLIHINILNSIFVILIQFMRWKKLYYKYCSKGTNREACTFLGNKCTQFGINDIENCIEGLFRFALIDYKHLWRRYLKSNLHRIVNSIGVNKRGAWKCLELLKDHRLFRLCKKIVEEHPQYEKYSADIFWNVVLHICLLSYDPWDVYNLIEMITKPSSELISSSVCKSLISAWITFT